MPFSRLMPEWKKFEARAMRKTPTKSEGLFWKAIRRNRIMGLQFQRQVPMLGYIADFYCPELGLIVELDGRFHDPEKDRIRDEHFKARGQAVIRIPSSLVIQNLPAALGMLRNACAALRLLLDEPAQLVADVPATRGKGRPGPRKSD